MRFYEVTPLEQRSNLFILSVYKPQTASFKEEKSLFENLTRLVQQIQEGENVYSDIEFNYVNIVPIDQGMDAESSQEIIIEEEVKEEKKESVDTETEALLKILGPFKSVVNIEAEKEEF